MKYLVIIFLLLIPCEMDNVIQIFMSLHSIKPKGALTLGTPFEDTATCPKDRKIIYKQISVNTNWENGYQNIEYSWQCTKIGTLNNTYRIKKILETYKYQEIE